MFVVLFYILFCFFGDTQTSNNIITILSYNHSFIFDNPIVYMKIAYIMKYHTIRIHKTQSN
jgi:hypothetical protein